jgi:hypothetical protein
MVVLKEQYKKAVGESQYLAWDNSINKKTIIKIVKSYTMA